MEKKRKMTNKLYFSNRNTVTIYKIQKLLLQCFIKVFYTSHAISNGEGHNDKRFSSKSNLKNLQWVDSFKSTLTILFVSTIFPFLMGGE